MVRVALASTALVCGALVVATRPAVARTLLSERHEHPFPGVALVRRVEVAPPNRVTVAFVSLCHDHVHVVSTAPAKRHATPAAWGAATGVQLAVNGDFFVKGVTPPRVYGDAVGAAEAWPWLQTGYSQTDAWYHAQHGFIAFGDGWVEFSHTKRTKLEDAERFGVRTGFSPREVTTARPQGTRALVSGFPELVIEGRAYTCASPEAPSCFPDRADMRARHPRTAMGLTEDRTTFILAVVDGRDAPRSVGMYGTELAELMAELGAFVAFNLDGGGSSALWLEGRGYVSSPSEAGGRAVANHWGVFAGPASGKPKAPGSCVAPGSRPPSALSSRELPDAPPSPGASAALPPLPAPRRLRDGCACQSIGRPLGTRRHAWLGFVVVAVARRGRGRVCR